MTGRVLFCGYYGHQNAGDDAFNAVAVWGARKFWQVEDCALLSSRLPKLPFPATAALPRPARFKGHAHLAAIAAALIQRDVVYAGGSTLHVKPDAKDFGFYHAWLQRVRGCRLSAIGVSIGPFGSARERDGVRAFLERFSFLALRDSRSFELACELGFGDRSVQSFDLAALLPELSEEPRPAKTDTIGVTLCRYESIVGGDLGIETLRLERMYRTLCGLASKEPDAAFRFYIFNTDPDVGDEQITRSMAARLALERGCRCQVVTYAGDPVALWRDVAACRLFIGTRLHSAVFAYMASVPFILAEYHPKCADFLDTIGYRALPRFPARFLPAGDAVAAATAVLETGFASLVSLPPAEAAKRAALNFTAVTPLSGYPWMEAIASGRRPRSARKAPTTT